MKLFWSLFLLLITFTLSYADKYQDAIKYYKQKQYNKSLDLLKDYAIKKNTNSAKQPQAMLLMAKIYINLNQYRNATFILKIFSEKYPSIYKNEYLYLNTLVSIGKHDYYGAVNQAVQLLKISKNPYYNRDLLNKIKMITVDSMKFDITKLQDLYNNTLEFPQINHIALFGIVKSFFLNKNYKMTQKYANIYLQKYRDYQFSEIVYNYMKTSENQKDSELKIAVLLPLTGEYAPYGKMILNSIELYKKTNNSKFTYQVFDTKADPVETINKIKAILAFGDFKAIIGPVTSVNVIAASAILSQYNIPLITPTATEDGISKIGKNIFQLNVSVKKLAEKIANYANDTLNLKNYVIVAPDNTYGRVQSESFKNYVESRGSRVVSLQYYKEGTQDYKDIMMSIRKTLLAEQIEKENFINGTHKDLSKMKKKDIDEIDLKVDGIFIPSSSPQELIMLIPQLLYYRITGVLLGSSGWYSNLVIKDAGQYLNDSYFSLYFYKIDRYEQRVSFENGYKNLYNEMPSKVSYLGYDAIAIIDNAIKAGYSKPSEITYYLQHLDSYQGVSGNITFAGTDGDNNGALIIKIKNKFFTKINK